LITAASEADNLESGDRGVADVPVSRCDSDEEISKEKSGEGKLNDGRFCVAELVTIRPGFSRENASGTGAGL